MKFNCGCKPLHDALAACAPAITTRAALFECGFISLTAMTDRVQVVATDGDFTISVAVEAAVQEAGHGLFEMEKLIGMLDCSDRAYMEARGEQYHIKTPLGKATIHSIEKFHSPIEDVPVAKLDITAEEINILLGATNNNGLPHEQGIHIAVHGDRAFLSVPRNVDRSVVIACAAPDHPCGIAVNGSYLAKALRIGKEMEFWITANNRIAVKTPTASANVPMLSSCYDVSQQLLGVPYDISFQVTDELKSFIGVANRFTEKDAVRLTANAGTAIIESVIGEEPYASTAFHVGYPGDLDEIFSGTMLLAACAAGANHMYIRRRESIKLTSENAVHAFAQKKFR